MDSKTAIFQIRAAGFTLELDDSGKPDIPKAQRPKLTPEQREMLGKWKEDIRLALEEEKRTGTLITPFDSPTWQELAEWWRNWAPPRESYFLAPGIEVTDPKKSYEYHRELLDNKEDCGGQTELALYAWIRRHWILFGKNTGGKR